MTWLSPELGLVLFNGLLVIVGGWFIYSSYARLKHQTHEIDRLHQSVRALQEQHGALSQSTVGMGKRIRTIQDKVEYSQQRSMFNTTDEASYQQAARLVSLGANAGDLVDNCGMARAEAELMVSMRRTAQ